MSSARRLGGITGPAGAEGGGGADGDDENGLLKLLRLKDAQPPSNSKPAGMATRNNELRGTRTIGMVSSVRMTVTLRGLWGERKSTRPRWRTGARHGIPYCIAPKCHPAFEA